MRSVRRFVAAASAALVAAGCGAQKSNLLLPNQAPEVELFAQRVDGSTVGPFTYRFQWSASAAGGRIDHFLYSFGSPADDPRHVTWTTTPAREQVMSFRSRGRDDGDDEEECGKIEPRVFSLRAVDAAGSISAPARVAVFNGTIAPHVAITTPAPNPLVRYYLGPTVCVAWRGTAADDDGVVSPEGVARYKFKLLTETTEVSLHTARSDPDSVRRYYAPRGWPGWESTPGNVTGTVLRDLTPDREYVFVVTCFDECGNYDPIFSYSTNMLYLRIVAGGPPPPTLTITHNNYLVYSGRGTDPTNIVNLEIPPGPSITFRWSATAEPGREITGYRWALNLPDRPDHDPEDDPRAGDTRARRESGWTRWSLTNTSATLGPFTGGGVHTLTVEARDNSGCDEDRSRVTRATIRLIVVQPTFTRDLLIVDDTRLLLDRINMGTACDHSSNRPIGNWPTAAELDTFLYASGGVPWRCYPAGTMSTPGILSGYDFDTLGTRLGIEDLTIRLSTLSRYRHVLWLVDAAAAGKTGPGFDLAESQTSMRYMNDIGMTNTLAAYVRQGGKVWIAGGGAATAALINFNRQSNDNTSPIPRTLTFSNGANELMPGRFIYDQGHWRSEFKQYRVSNGRIRRYLGRFDPFMGGNPGLYAGLPVEIQLKSPATDPFPPNRTGQPQIQFYMNQFDIEFLSAANEILEDLDPRPHREDFQSALDSLYKATASTLQPDTGPGAVQSVVMTYYHGQENAPFVHTGFNLWSYRRSHCVALVDFVLQQLWGMTRQGPVPAPIEVDARGAGPPVGRSGRTREGVISASAPAPGRSR